MTMSMVFLLCATTRLTSLSPGLLNSLPTCTTNVRCVFECIAILTIFFVIVNVHTWDAANNVGSNVGEIWKPLLESHNTVFVVPAFNVIAPGNEMLIIHT